MVKAILIISTIFEQLKGPFIIYGRGWAGKNVGGASKILDNLRGGHKKYANRLWVSGHLLLNNLFSDMFIKANIYYKI